jgi:hypothetical protein
LGLAEVFAISDWDFSPLAELSHLRTFLLGVDDSFNSWFRLEDAVQLLTHLSPSLEVFFLI